RPLPLAGVIFSMPSREAARTVRHHWSKDNRWDALPASVMALPADLRPRKPGINRQQVAAVTGAVALALTGASMLVSFVGNHRLIAAAQVQSEQVLHDKQPLESRLHALTTNKERATRKSGPFYYLQATRSAICSAFGRPIIC
ncbi:hypothetical protein ACNSWB_003446, partial [Cronobacter sakazakii]